MSDFIDAKVSEDILPLPRSYQPRFYTPTQEIGPLRPPERRSWLRRLLEWAFRERRER